MPASGRPEAGPEFRLGGTHRQGRLWSTRTSACLASSLCQQHSWRQSWRQRGQWRQNGGIFATGGMAVKWRHSLAAKCGTVAKRHGGKAQQSGRQSGGMAAKRHGGKVAAKLSGKMAAWRQSGGMAAKLAAKLVPAAKLPANLASVQSRSISSVSSVSVSSVSSVSAVVARQARSLLPDKPGVVANLAAKWRHSFGGKVAAKWRQSAAWRQSVMAAKRGKAGGKV
eukprot:gene15035-biopygen10501